MFKLLCATAAAVTLTAAAALADGSCCCNAAVPASTAATRAAPAPSVARNPGVQSNRSFSYQPSTAAPMYRPAMNRPIMNSYGFRGADAKARGNY